MLKYLSKAKHIFLSKKFIEFCLFGGFNTLSNATFSWLASLFMQANMAAVFGYVVSITINYVLNSKIIFKRMLSFEGYIKFVISYVPNFIIYFLVTFATINTFGLSQFWGTLLAAMVGGPITFIILKFYAFNSNSESENEDTKSK